MNSEQKLREALQAAYEAHKDDFEQPWLSLAAEALAAPAGEQVELTDEEIDEAACGILCAEELDMVRRVIAAHEAKRGGA